VSIEMGVRLLEGLLGAAGNSQLLYAYEKGVAPLNFRNRKPPRKTRGPASIISTWHGPVSGHGSVHEQGLRRRR
jgi:hypothetical protein